MDARQILTEWLILIAQAGDDADFTGLHDLWQVDLRRLALMWVERPDAAAKVVINPSPPGSARAPLAHSA